MSNYGTLVEEDAVGLKFIVDCASGKKLYLWPPCRICGITRYSHETVPDEKCRACAAVECNDNPEPMEMFQ